MLLLTFWMNFGSLRARFGPIDDHELADFLGADKRLSFWSIPSEWISKTEVGNLGSGTRFRWLYSLQRLFEVAVFRDNAGFMYAVRTITIALGALLIFLILYQNIEINKSERLKSFSLQVILSLPIPVAATIWYLSTISITSGFSRIGTQEPGLVLGLLLVTFGLLRIVRDPLTMGRVNFLLIAFGSIVATGFKENGYVVILPLMLGLIIRLKYLFKWPEMAALLIASISMAAVLYHNVRALARGSDTIVGTKSGAGMVHAILDRFDSPRFLLILACFLILVSVSQKLANSAAKSNVVILAWCLTLHLSEAVFYGEDTVVMRYEAVSDIATILAVSVTVQAVLNLTSPEHALLSLRNIFQYPLIAVVLVLYLYPFQIFSQLRDASYSLARSTRGYQQTIENLSFYLSEHPSSSLVIYLFDTAADAEPSHAMIKYLRMEGIENSIFFAVREVDAIPSETLLGYRKLSENGNKYLSLEPWFKLQRSSSDACFSPTYNLDNPAVPEANEVQLYCGYLG